VLHENPHTPLLQVGEPFCGAPQIVPHAPQCCVFVLVLTH
jgi:hypothetical protein